MAKVLTDIRSKVVPGTVIPKPEAQGEFVFKRWGKRRGEDAFVYTIPNHKDPTKPYEKGITNSEWEMAATHLRDAGDFTHPWFNQFMPACAAEGSCNFTTIGGVFELLDYAAYDRRGAYRSKQPL